MLFRSFLVALTLILALTVLATGCTPKPVDKPEPAKPVYISIATGGTGGVYFPLGGKMADILNKNVKNMNATAQSTNASVANINMIGSKEVEIAFIQNDTTYYAYTGTEGFVGKKIENVRGIASVYDEVVQLVATEASGIKSVNDLKGKRVAVGAQGSGTELNARQILEAFGMKYADLAKTDYLSFAEAAGNMKDGHIDAAFITGGVPTSAVIDMSKTSKVVVVPVSGAEATALLAKYPFYGKVTIPANTYDGQPAGIETVAVKAIIVVRADLDEALVYDITKALFSNLADFGAVHARGKDLTLATAKTAMPIPFHPGAEKYYKEQGK